MLVVLLVIGFASGVASQDHAPANSSAQPKAYEVVSIKPSNPDAPSGTESSPNGFRDMNITLEILVKDAYGTYNESQVIGMPSWAKSDRYDVYAKVDADIADAWKGLSNEERWKQNSRCCKPC
jgi:hypothetical protein